MNVTRADRLRLEAIVLDRSAPQKHVWRANIILATADGCGTAEIMRRSGKSKPVVWRWQARFMAEGVEGLTRDKDAHARQTTAVDRHRAECCRPGARTATGRRNPLDSNAGESGRSEPAIGATYPRGPPTRAAFACARSSCRRTRSSPRSSKTVMRRGS